MVSQYLIQLYLVLAKLAAAKSSQNYDTAPIIAWSQSLWEIVGWNGQKSLHDGSNKSSKFLGKFAWYLEKQMQWNTGKIGVSNHKIEQNCNTC